jgi:hypothetical protein
MILDSVKLVLLYSTSMMLDGKRVGLMRRWRRLNKGRAKVRLYRAESAGESAVRYKIGKSHHNVAEEVLALWRSDP